MKKKSRTKKDVQKETETEAMISFSLSFPIDSLLAQEIRVGVVRELGGKEQNDNIDIRNHILALWRGNVRVWLEKGHIIEFVRCEYDHFLTSAYELLYKLILGFCRRLLLSCLRQLCVVVNGVGLVGLAAMR